MHERACFLRDYAPRSRRNSAIRVALDGVLDMYSRAVLGIAGPQFQRGFLSGLKHQDRLVCFRKKLALPQEFQKL